MYDSYQARQLVLAGLLVVHLAADEDMSHLDIESGLAALTSYSMAKWTPSKDAVILHRLVQHITVFRQSHDQRSTELPRALWAVHDFIPEDPECYDVASWPTVYDPCCNHIAAVAGSGCAAGIAIPTFRLLNCLAGYYKTKGLYRLAEQLMRTSLAICEAEYGPLHPEVALALSNLGVLRRNMNALAEAETLLRRAVEIELANFGDCHPRLAVRLNNLAAVLLNTNRQAYAEDLLRRAIEIDESCLGPNDPNLAVRLDNLGVVLQNNGRHAESIPLHERALSIDNSIAGANHPRAATRMANLANALRETGRVQDAESMLARSLAIDELHYGPNHISVGSDLLAIAELLRRSGRHVEAEAKAFCANVIFLKHQGLTGCQHVQAGDSQTCYVLILESLGRTTGQIEVLTI